jgi:hypothetical protein
VTQEMILSRAAALNRRQIFAEVFVVSALKGENTAALVDHLMVQAVPREWEFPASTVRCCLLVAPGHFDSLLSEAVDGRVQTSDQSMLAKVVEVVREKLFLRFNKEIPYLVRQRNMGWTELPNGYARDCSLSSPFAGSEPECVCVGESAGRWRFSRCCA